MQRELKEQAKCGMHSKPHRQHDHRLWMAVHHSDENQQGQRQEQR
jgi:hypothetical protein